MNALVSYVINLTRLFILTIFYVCFIALSDAHAEIATQAKPSIISLAPHTTELIYALGAGQQLLAVSDFSDFPEQAQSLPKVASYHGLDFEQILRLSPDLIVAWQGGNKPQDLTKLATLGFKVYLSGPKQPAGISQDIRALGAFIARAPEAEVLASDFTRRLLSLKQQFAGAPQVDVFYYMWPTPLMSIGPNAWATHLLEICGAHNVFASAPTDYPQVNIEQVARKQPTLMIAAMHVSPDEAESFWHDKRDLIPSPVIVVNPDKLHRFTPRLLNGLTTLCNKIRNNG
ncbi:MAG: cobalamin-binding protein [Paraglaciecola polaris]|uniref:cobalamin-binding protein n=1 Tax=Paraglaciecola polaris TaxID=222814 RepID=UPI0030039900|tara:strand:- start:20415 stop:21275 length:861 start_codon:yes stop_codon:yes gene_type:complete